MSEPKVVLCWCQPGEDIVEMIPYSDYEALAARVTRLREVVDAAKAYIAGPHDEGEAHWPTLLPALKKAVAALKEKP